MNDHPEPCRSLLSGRRRFSEEWLASGGRQVVPFASPTPQAASNCGRIASAMRRAGVSDLLIRDCRPGAEQDLTPLPVTEVEAISARIAEQAGDDLLIAASDLSSAVLVTADGYCLAAGGPLFLDAISPGGVDAGRVRFARDAARLGQDHPLLPEVAAQFPPRFRSFSSPRDLAPGSSTQEQYDLMTSLVAGDIAVPAFFVAWLSARRQALATGERVGGKLAEALDEVFSALEDYPLDPDLREDGDPTDEDVVSSVRSALHHAE